MWLVYTRVNFHKRILTKESESDILKCHRANASSQLCCADKCRSGRKH